MPQVHVDAEALRQFSAQLKAFADFVGDSLQGVQGQVSRLSDTWRDQEFEAFQSEFSKTYQLLGRFIEEAERTAPLLLRDAEAIDEYVRVKP